MLEGNAGGSVAALPEDSEPTEHLSASRKAGGKAFIKDVEDAPPEEDLLPPVAGGRALVETDPEGAMGVCGGRTGERDAECPPGALNGATESNKRFMASTVASFMPLAEVEENAHACNKSSLPLGCLTQHTKVYRPALPSSTCFKENLSSFTSGRTSGEKKAIAILQSSGRCPHVHEQNSH